MERIAASRGGIPITEGRLCLIPEPPVFQLSPGASPGRALELFAVERRRLLMESQQRLALPGRLPFLRTAGGLGDLDAGTGGEVSDGLGERQLLVQLHELDHVAAGVAPEALEEALVPVDVEGRR